MYLSNRIAHVDKSIMQANHLRINVNKAGMDGIASSPSIKRVKRTVMSGMIHLLVYVRLMPIRSKAIELQ